MTTYSAHELFEVIDDLRTKVEEAYANEKWASDAQFARSYKDIATLCAGVYRNDPVIGGLQVSIPPEIDALIARDASCLTAWVRIQVGRLATRLAQLARRELATSHTLVELDLTFMQSNEFRYIAAQDFVEAQRAFYSNAPKAAAVMFGGAIEAMVIDALQQRDSDALNWDQAGLAQLLGRARDSGLIREATFRLASNAKDFRDTVHPQAERRTGERARVEDASVLLSIVSLIAADLEHTLNAVSEVAPE